MAGNSTGGCQCGYVRYLVDGNVLALGICHCRDCQRQSGSAFGMSLIVPGEAFQLTAGSLKSFDVECDSGRVKTCAFCPECGVRIYHATGARKSVKAGTLDDTSWLRPDAHYWTQRKQAWFKLPEDVPCHLDDG